MKKLAYFKTYGIRGKLDGGLDKNITWRIDRTCGEFLKPKAIVLGDGVRLASGTLELAPTKGLQDAGVDVLDISMPGTEEIYFTMFHLGVNGGTEVIVSCNPMDYNGMKPVREGARLISGDTGLHDVQRLVETSDLPLIDEAKRGRYQQVNLRGTYADHLFGCINAKNLVSLKLVVNSRNSAVGPVVDAIEAHSETSGAPVELIKMHNIPDDSFPSSVSNPLPPECHDNTRNVVIKYDTDTGITLDSDSGRCSLFDEKGQFIKGCCITGPLTETFLEKNPGTRITHDPRLSQNIVDTVTAADGTPAILKIGHAFIKERMCREDAIYGGEVGVRHYFRDFVYCNNGVTSWLLVAELVCLKGKTLGELVRNRMTAFPANDKIGGKLAQSVETINRVKQHFSREVLVVGHTNDVNITFADWRFDLRSSNTEPVVWLNVGSHGDVPPVETQTRALLTLLNG